ncbi:MAG: XTP/dITP diphosphatase [Desulfuromonadia bacterium]
MVRELLVATTNRGKFAEIRHHLAPLVPRIVPLWEIPSPPPIVESGETFRENALIKARALVRLTRMPTLADDSGLVVYALGGRPGVWSARYAGEGATDRENNEKLLREMAHLPDGSRGASFVCVITLVFPDGRELTAEGRVEGEILRAPRGEGGFGYDPLFFVRGTDRTMAELPLEVKNRSSHRGIALDRLVEMLGNYCLQDRSVS